MTDFQQYLASAKACSEARDWAGDRTAAEAWEQCERADWLLWWAAQTVDQKIVVRLTCRCARRALRFIPAGELRPLRTIETAEAWCDGRATIREVREAADAASAAAAAADAADAAYAYAAYASSAAADAAYAAYAYAADAAYARREEHLAMCALIREAIPFSLIEAGMRRAA